VEVGFKRCEICIVQAQRQVAAVALIPAFQPGVGSDDFRKSWSGLSGRVGGNSVVTLLIYGDFSEKW
jgi:hypothetical protein